MTIKLLLIYVGILLVVGIALIAAVKNLASGFAVKIKRPVIISLLIALLTAGSSYLVTLLTGDLFITFWLFAAIYLLFAVIHRSLVHKKYFFSVKENQEKVLFGEALFTLSILFFSIIFFFCFEYFFRDRHFLFYPVLMSSLAFFFPFLVTNTFDAAYTIPEPDFSKWQYPNAPIRFEPMKDSKKLLLSFEIAKKPSEKKTMVPAKGVESWQLGDLFYYFINDYNDDPKESGIEYMDDENEAYVWWFHRKVKWYQRPYVLDPKLDLYKNKIKDNTIVICERIPNH